MGIGISGMHYTGMLAATFHKDMAPPGSHMEVQTFHWSIFVTLIIFVSKRYCYSVPMQIESLLNRANA